MKINTEYITLGQLLKFSGYAHSGGDIKHMLSEVEIKINDELENRRGKKLYPGDVIIIGQDQIKIEND